MNPLGKALWAYLLWAGEEGEGEGTEGTGEGRDDSRACHHAKMNNRRCCHLSFVNKSRQH